MLRLDRSTSVTLPSARGSRLTHARLRRPTRLPSMGSPSAGVGDYLRRLIWRFSGA